MFTIRHTHTTDITIVGQFVDFGLFQMQLALEIEICGRQWETEK